MKHPAIHTLENGLPVMLIDTEAFPSITTMLLVGAGSRYENPKNNGIAHFFEHMAFKGSERFPTAYDISSRIEGMGGVFNAFTSKDHTGYYVKAPGEHFSDVVSILSDMITRSLLDPQEIEREKGVIVEEINMYEDMPSRRVSDFFDMTIFPDHPLGYDVAGTADTVRSFDRATFTDYMAERYYPGNAVLVVAGGLSRGSDAYLGEIRAAFDPWKQHQAATRKYEKFDTKQTNVRIHVEGKKTEQAHFCLGYPTFGFGDPRRYALSVLSTILGGGMSSRLFIEVRERRGLCYYVSTGRELYDETGYIVTQAGVSKDEQQLNEAIRTILAEHEAIAGGKTSEDELTRAKEMLKGRLVLSLEDSYRIASLHGTRYLFERDHIDIEEIIARIDRVSRTDVTGLARELFVPERLNIALVGPYTRESLTVV